MNIGICTSCGADILWVKSIGGSPMPLNAQSVGDGNIAVIDNVGHVRKGEMFEPFYDGPLYKSHFATCPNAAKHRKSKKEKS